jgi:hypothetical protein
MENLDWTYEEFVCFTLIYTSNSDLDISGAEIKSITLKFGEEVFAKQMAYFDQLNDFQALNTILSFKEKYFSTEKEKEKLLDHIKNQYFTDGYSDVEKEVYLFLNRLL